MTSWVPVEGHAWQESRARTEQRYVAIASAIERVALDPEEEPLALPPVVPLAISAAEQPRRAWTALVLASIASHESYFRRDIDECRVSGDGGKVAAWGLFQLAVRRSVACDDRVLATRVALGMVRSGFVRCTRVGFLDRLSLFTNGRCERSPSARARSGRAQDWWARAPWLAPVGDP